MNTSVNEINRDSQHMYKTIKLTMQSIQYGVN